MRTGWIWWPEIDDEDEPEPDVGRVDALRNGNRRF
jgi:hypothetical protein